MGKTVKKVVKTVTKTVKNVIKNPLPVIETIALTAIGIPPPVANAVVSAANGGKVEDIAKAAIGSVVGSAVGQAVGQTVGVATGSEVLGKIAASASASTTAAAITGGNVSQAFVTGVISSGVTQAYEGVKTALADTGTTTDVTAPTTGPVAPTTPAAPTTPTEAPTTDYSLTAGVTTPGQGLKAPELAPLPPVEQIGQTPVDYTSIIAPTTPSQTFAAPQLKELPPAQDIGKTPIDYTSMLQPSTSNLGYMGGGTGLTATTPAGETMQGQQMPFTERLGEEATKAGEKLLTSAITSGLTSGMYDQQPARSTSTLTSTGLFSPTSIVPTALTGIAPIGRGKPILGGEDEEATGTWGTKTLRG